MRCIQLFIATSLDGYIARTSGVMDLLALVLLGES